MQRRRSTLSKPRKEFILKSLLVHIIFVTQTIVQLFLAIHFEDNLTLFKGNNILCVLAFSVGVFHYLFYFLVESIRLIKVFNLVIAFFIVECLTLSTVSTIISLSVWQLLGSILTALCLLALFFCIAAIIKYDFTLNVVFLYIFSYIFCIGTVYFLTLYAVDRVSYGLYSCLGIIMIVLYMFNVYFAQCIIGGFYTELRLTDYILAALTIYVNFFLLLLMSVNFAILIAEAVEV